MFLKYFMFCVLVAVLFVGTGTAFFASPAYAATGTISANPNPVYIPYGSSTGTTTITWSASGTTAQVWVSVNGAAETNFATGKSGSQAATWIQPGSVYVFKLYDGTSHTPPALASVTVNGLRPTGTISANPWTDATAASGNATTTITWSTVGCTSAQVWVSMDGAAEGNFATGASGSQAATWIQPGHWYEFRLYAETSHTYRLASVRVYGRTTEYQVGMNYYKHGVSIETTSFLSQYHTTYNGVSVRTTVQGQLQDMANRGATTVRTCIWLTSTQTGAFGPNETFKWHFPPWDGAVVINGVTYKELDNLRQFAQDVAAIVATDGHRLKLQISLMPNWASDYHVGTPGTTLGNENLTAAQMLQKWTDSYTTIINHVYDITRGDGLKVVESVYLMWEVMVKYHSDAGWGGKTNDDWFLLNEWPGFVTFCGTKGVTPTIYFQAFSTDAEIIPASYTDSYYPVLNNHLSMYWPYRSLRFMMDNNLPIPARIDWSQYIDRTTHTYAELVQRVFDDADAVLPIVTYNTDLTVKSMVRKYYGVVETYYPTNNATRETFADAFSAQRLINNRVTRIEFWPINIDLSSVGPPFEMEDYLP